MSINGLRGSSSIKRRFPHIASRFAGYAQDDMRLVENRRIKI